MSLILYDGVPEEEEEWEYSLVINSTVNRVRHNRFTNEISIVDGAVDFGRRGSFMAHRCPHCGSEFSDGPSDHTNDFLTRQGAAETVNYFGLLESSFTAVDSLFTQGYFDKFFKKIGFLGNGSNGSVFKVEHWLNGTSLGLFALKKVTIGSDERLLERTLKEVKMLSKLSAKSPNLVNYNHVWFEIDSINDFGPKVPCAFILEQYYPGGNLEDLVNDLKSPKWTVKDLKKHKHRKPQGRYLTNREILYMFRDISKGLAALHHSGVIHRDLKPSNILLTANYCSDMYQNEADLNNLPTVVIGDFGESQFLGERRMGTGFTGTIEYSAPEVFLYNESVDLRERVSFDEKTDMFSMGMILYFLCFSDLPSSVISATEWDALIKASVDVDQLELLQKRATDFDIGCREGLHLRYKSLIRRMTSKDPEQRLTSDQLLKELDELDHLITADEEEVMVEVDAPVSKKDHKLIWTTAVMIVQTLELFLICNMCRYEVVYASLFLNGVSIRGPMFHKLLLIATMTTLLTLIFTF